MARSSSYIAGWGTTRPRAALSWPGPSRLRLAIRFARSALCVAKLIDGRISIPEQLLRGGRRTDRTARSDANGTEKEATGTSKARLRDGQSHR